MTEIVSRGDVGDECHASHEEFRLRGGDCGVRNCELYHDLVIRNGAIKPVFMRCFDRR